jgi:hypothetical protein
MTSINLPTPEGIRPITHSPPPIFDTPQPPNPRVAFAAPQVVAKAAQVGSPAVAGNPVTGDWLPNFMQAQPKVDFVTLHWYKGADARKFIKDVQALCEAYKKPVWVTEFAPQTAAQAKASPDKYSQEQVNQFIQQTVAWMHTSPCVERYAWHDAKAGTSALFDDKGHLSATGKAYAQAQ